MRRLTPRGAALAGLLLAAWLALPTPAAAQRFYYGPYRNPGVVRYYGPTYSSPGYYSGPGVSYYPYTTSYYGGYSYPYGYGGRYYNAYGGRYYYPYGGRYYGRGRWR
jgi:hypothetical protein